ncbi:MAG: hypothetical protein RLZZ480_725 [Candidatus Parcubacteria bacterium]|jgi:uncharacterized protein YggE
MNTFFTSTFNRLLGTVALAMIVAALGSYAVLTMRTAEITEEIPATISVSGEGEAKVTPNIAEVSFTIRTFDKKADVAQSSTTARMNDIIGMVKGNGVEDKDIKTTGFDLYEHYPEYAYEPACDMYSLEYGMGGEADCAPTEYKPDGFEAAQTITVRIRDISKAGLILAEAAKRGATNISGLSFTVDDKMAGKTEARDKALKNARERAEQVASQLGVRIKRMTGYYENDFYTDPFSPNSYDAEYMGKTASGEPYLQAGEVTVKSTVNVSFEIE